MVLCEDEKSDLSLPKEVGSIELLDEKSLEGGNVENISLLDKYSLGVEGYE